MTDHQRRQALANIDRTIAATMDAKEALGFERANAELDALFAKRDRILRAA